MQKIISSASKIVFILIAITASVGFFIGILDPKDFMVLAGMAFSFYFSNKGDPTQPFAGK
jgi:putative solute:sodium symporter small subunit